MQRIRLAFKVRPADLSAVGSHLLAKGYAFGAGPDASAFGSQADGNLQPPHLRSPASVQIVSRTIVHSGSDSMKIFP